MNAPGEKAKLTIGDKTLELSVVEGTEQEKGIDISKLRSQTGYITLDDGYGNTGSCKSAITFIDGEKGILRYRGYPIEELAAHCTFVETAYLLIYGELPTKTQLTEWSALFTQHQMIHEGLRHHYDGFPLSGHPMAILSAMINAVSTYHPDVLNPEDESTFESAAARLISKTRTIAAAAYKASIGRPIMYPKPDYDYCTNFLHMMFSLPNWDHVPAEEAVHALNLMLVLHADHEQNCSTSTVRMVASAGANLFASCAAGVCALWGPLHGGANVAVIDMLEKIREQKIPLKDYVARVKDKTSNIKLMGFGHRVYKSYDPRAKILKQACDKVLEKLHIVDPSLDMAQELEQVALSDPYFVERSLYPNVDFYSGIIMRALGIPANMFTVIFAMGRMPGWIAHWKEMWDQKGRIYRPRQIYTGYTQRPYKAMSDRG
jgi:citrate synthase